MREKLKKAAMIATIATLAATADAAGAQTIAWLTTNFGSADPVESYGGGILSTLGTGQYEVTFPGAGNGLNSDVQISAVDYFAEGSPHYCTSAGWSTPNGTDVDVYVDCFDTTGAAVNGDFAAFYEARTSAPSSGWIAYLWANQPTTASYTPSSLYSYDSMGGTIIINRDNVGLYFAFLPGIPRDVGNPQVTAYGSTAAHCEVADWYHNRSGVNVVVQCVNAAGQPADEYFDLAFAYGVSHGDSPATAPGGYAWANNAVAANYKPLLADQFNNISTLPIKAGNNGYGIGFIELPVVGADYFQPYLGLVTAIGSHGEFCDQSHIEQDTSKPKHPNFYLVVQCFNAQGQDLADEYTAAVVAK